MQVAARNNFCVQQHAPDALHEVAYIAPRLKAEQIELKQRVQEPLLLRKLRKNIVRRKGDVQEKRQSRKVSGDASLPQCLGDVHQVIIVHPDKIVGVGAPNNGIRVAVVDFLVSLPVCRLEVAEILQVMKQRPDHFVGIAVVKLIALGFTQSHRDNLVTGVAPGFGKRFLWDFTRNSRPADPGSAALAQHRLDRGD